MLSATIRTASESPYSIEPDVPCAWWIACPFSRQPSPPNSAPGSSGTRSASFEETPAPAPSRGRRWPRRTELGARQIEGFQTAEMFLTDVELIDIYGSMRFVAPARIFVRIAASDVYAA